MKREKKKKYSTGRKESRSRMAFLAAGFVLVALCWGGTAYGVAASDETPDYSDAWKSVQTRFSDYDINSHWASESVADVVSKGIMNGYPDGTFKADNDVTVGELLKMTCSVADKSELAGSDLESVDIHKGNCSKNWAEGWYARGLKEGWYTESDIDYGMLNQEADRKHAALIMANAFDAELPEADRYQEIIEGISDIDAETDYEFEIVKVYNSGIFGGYEDGSFKPDEAVTRAQAAAVFSRISEQSEAAGDDAVTTGQAVGTGQALSTGTAVETGKGGGTDAAVKSEKAAKSASESGDKQSTAESAEAEELPGEPIENYIDISELSKVRILDNKKYAYVCNDHPYKISISTYEVTGFERIIIDDASGYSGILVKNKKIKELLGFDNLFVVNEYNPIVPKDFDYIGLYKSTEETIMLIPNPWK